MGYRGSKSCLFLVLFVSSLQPTYHKLSLVINISLGNIFLLCWYWASFKGLALLWPVRDSWYCTKLLLDIFTVA